MEPALASTAGYVKILNDVLIDTGFWAVIDQDKIYSSEIFGRSMSLSPRVSGRITPDAKLLVATLEPPCVHVEEPCVLIGGDDNYSHWLTRNLMKLCAVEKNAAISDLPLLVHEDLKSFQREYIELLGINPDRLIKVPRHAIVACKNVAVPTVFRNQPWMLEGIVWFRHRLREHLQSSKKFGKRLFISREDSGIRKLLNERALFHELEKMDFQCLQLGQMTVREQLAAFAGAEIVVGPHGAGLTNMIYAPKTAKLVEITSTFIDHIRDFRFIAEQLGQSHTCVTCDDYNLVGNDYHNVNCDFSADIDEVMVVVEAMLNADKVDQLRQ
jgi:capsular polysaccharide biosynthesis protein